MPLHDYLCSDCGERFEALVTASRPAACPACTGQRLERQLSGFAVSGSTRPESAGPGSCGTCGDPRGPGT